MKIRSKNAATPIFYIFSAFLAFGVGNGVVRSAHLGVISAVLSVAAIGLILFLIFRSGRASSFSQAQAWAQNEVDIVMEVANTAISKANALSNAYASAIANANATASNEVIVNVNDETSRQIEQLTRELAKDEKLNAQSLNMAVGELNAQELADVRSSTDSQGRLSTPIFKG